MWIQDAFSVDGNGGSLEQAGLAPILRLATGSKAFPYRLGGAMIRSLAVGRELLVLL